MKYSLLLLSLLIPHTSNCVEQKREETKFVQEESNSKLSKFGPYLFPAVIGIVLWAKLDKAEKNKKGLYITRAHLTEALEGVAYEDDIEDVVRKHEMRHAISTGQVWNGGFQDKQPINISDLFRLVFDRFQRVEVGQGTLKGELADKYCTQQQVAELLDDQVRNTAESEHQLGLRIGKNIEARENLERRLRILETPNPREDGGAQEPARPRQESVPNIKIVPSDVVAGGADEQDDDPLGA